MLNVTLHGTIIPRIIRPRQWLTFLATDWYEVDGTEYWGLFIQETAGVMSKIDVFIMRTNYNP